MIKTFVPVVIQNRRSPGVAGRVVARGSAAVSRLRVDVVIAVLTGSAAPSGDLPPTRVSAGLECRQHVLAASPRVLYDRPSSSRRCAVFDPQLAVFETAIADRWMIEREFGRGSRATVYRARDVASGEAVALEAFRSDLASAVDAARFVAPIRPTAGIRHEHIMPIIGSRSPTKHA